jgi:hypothetical protein
VALEKDKNRMDELLSLKDKEFKDIKKEIA